MFTWVPAFGGIVSAKLLSDIDYISHTFLPKLRQLLLERRNYLGTLLDARGIPYVPPDAGIFVFVDFSQWLSCFDGDDKEREIALLEYLMDRGVFVEPGQAFFSAVPGNFRLNYGSEGPAFSLGTQRLLAALKELDGDRDSSGAADILGCS